MAISIVLVDDVAEVRTLLRIALRVRPGFEVVGEAADGGEAVSLIARLRPDVVVLDVGLPDLAGRELLTQIRRDSPQSKVVVFSGAEPSDRAWLADHVDGLALEDGKALEDGNLEYLIDLLEHVGQRPTRQATLPLNPHPESVRRARDFVRGALVGWGVDDVSADALLVVSELVTNAITHVQGGCELRLSTSETAVRIEVVDHGDGTPDPRTLTDDKAHGRGLYLVASLTSAWGVQIDPDGGKLVWAELMRPSAGDAAR